jgi:hypothetical protein
MGAAVFENSTACALGSEVFDLVCVQVRTVRHLFGAGGQN